MLILASGSARRREMLDRLGVKYALMPTDADETVTEALAPPQYVSLLACRKAEAACLALQRKKETEGKQGTGSIKSGEGADVILTADTVVALDGVIYGKPAGYEEAVKMLESFSGRTHQVYTAFALYQGDRRYVEAVGTEVTFRPLSRREIDHYIQKEPPYDKAGAYGIQEMAGIFVTGIRGSFDNVVGLPLTQVELALQREFSLSLFDFMA